MSHAKNLILYGPPGTGKTYSTVIHAVAIIEGEDTIKIKDLPYQDVLSRYNDYKKSGRIAFITFHQNYGYEDFIEGIRPLLDKSEGVDETLTYECHSGIFKDFCRTAESAGVQNTRAFEGLNARPTVWKVSLGGAGQNSNRTECLQNNAILINSDYDNEGCDEEAKSYQGRSNALNAFFNGMQIGDIVVSCYNERFSDAVGVVSGDVEFIQRDRYNLKRKVNWCFKTTDEKQMIDIQRMNDDTKMAQCAVYRLNIPLADIISSVHEKLGVSTQNSGNRPIENRNRFVFIIDEINRGNISKIFGELITLIEDDKRIDANDVNIGMRIRLPYSGERLFGVPNNVYILGTMNTADRSLTPLDTALRRRFEFEEMMPRPELLDFNIGEINIKDLLTKMNERIEALYDREHQIGHAYFWKLKQQYDDSNQSNPTINDLAIVMKEKIIPLLQEYFFDDWEKIRLVLGDNQKDDKELQFITCTPMNGDRRKELFGENVVFDEGHNVYAVNSKAFDKSKAYEHLGWETAKPSNSSGEIVDEVTSPDVIA